MLHNSLQIHTFGNLTYESQTDIDPNEFSVRVLLSGAIKNSPLIHTCDGALESFSVKSQCEELYLTELGAQWRRWQSTASRYVGLEIRRMNGHFFRSFLQTFREFRYLLRCRRHFFQRLVSPQRSSMKMESTSGGHGFKRLLPLAA